MKKYRCISSLILCVMLFITMLMTDIRIVHADDVVYIRDVYFEKGRWMSVGVGQSESLGIKIEPENHTEQLSLSSSNNSILTVDASGNITGIAPGTARVKYSYGPTSGELYVAVLADHPQALICEYDNVYRDATYPTKLEAVVMPETASQEIVWSSEDESIATITNDGVVTGLKAGSVRIKATVKGQSDVTADYLTLGFNTPETPYDPNAVELQGVTVPNGRILVGVNSTVLPEWQIYPEDCNQKIYYRSEDTSIATVDENGKVTGIKPGHTQISVGTHPQMFGGSWQIDTYVTNGETQIFIKGPKIVSCDVRIYDHLEADIIPDAERYEVEWLSSDDSIASIDEKGVITYHKSGFVTFTARIKQIPDIFDKAYKIVCEGLEDEIVQISAADQEIIDDAVGILRSNEINEIKSTLEDSNNAQESLKKIENTYNTKNNISVASDSDVDTIPATGIDIVGAGLNTENQNSELRLEIDKSSKNDFDKGDYTDVRPFDMELYEKGKNVDLSIPIIVSLPVPEGMNPKSTDILHVRDDGTTEVINSEITGDNGKKLVLSHCSTFAFAQCNRHLEWNHTNGKSYWYENGVKQGTYDDPKGVMGDGSIRGREIYDPASNAWYWLDSIYDGAKACGKEVWMPYIFQNEAEWKNNEDELNRNAADSGAGAEGNEEHAELAEQVKRAIKDGTGKWVRYDNEGKMMKGWVTIKDDLAALYPDQVGNTYYYDRKTGLMAKGETVINGVTYYFDEITGVLR